MQTDAFAWADSCSGLTSCWWSDSAGRHCSFRLLTSKQQEYYVYYRDKACPVLLPTAAQSDACCWMLATNMLRCCAALRSGNGCGSIAMGKDTHTHTHTHTSRSAEHSSSSGGPHKEKEREKGGGREREREREQFWGESGGANVVLAQPSFQGGRDRRSQARMTFTYSMPPSSQCDKFLSSAATLAPSCSAPCCSQPPRTQPVQLLTAASLSKVMGRSIECFASMLTLAVLKLSLCAISGRQS